MSIQYKPINSDLLEIIKVYNLTLPQELQLHPFLMELLARRSADIAEVETILAQSLENLGGLNNTPELELAVERISRAIDNQELIGIQTDYDSDGQTSQAILVKSLTEIFGHPKHLIRTFIGRRLIDGYGVTPFLTKQILSSKCSLLITADNGSSDIITLQELKQQGVDVILTDHHLAKLRPPCYAFINPACCAQSDKHIAGCTVAWLTMLGVQKYLLALGRKTSKNQLFELLDLVTIGTLADCVSLKHSSNNRIIVKHGLKLLNRTPRIFMRSFMQEHGRGTVTKLEEEHITFYLSPLLNAASRVGKVEVGVAFLLEEDPVKSLSLLNTLKEYNHTRKLAQQVALKEASKQIQGSESSLAIYIPESNAGLNGIIASKLMHQLQLTAAVFSPSAKAGVVVGSIRANHLLPCVKTLLDSMQQEETKLIMHYGGHAKAAGLSILQTNLPNFFSSFKKQVKINSRLGDGIIWADTPFPDLPPKKVLELLSSLGPYGNDWEHIKFFDRLTVTGFARFGRPAKHLRIKLLIQNKFKLAGIMFNPKSLVTLCELLKNHRELEILGTLAWDDYTGEAVLRILKLRSVC
jgi:single-stranded-DNA-specific exonuclease